MLDAGAAPCSRLASPIEGGDSEPLVCALEGSRYLCPASSPFACGYSDGGGTCFPTALETFDWCGGLCQQCDATDAQWQDGGGCYGAPPPPSVAPLDGGTTWPQIPWLGGAVLHDPQMVVLSFDELAADAGAGQPTIRDTFEQYYRWLTGSPWLTTVGSQYGVTGAGLLAVAHLGPAPAMLTDAEVQALIEGKISSGAIPAPTPETVYFLHTPETTQVVWGDQVLCTQFTGYHGWDGARAYAQDGGLCAVPIAYTVVATCPPPTGAQFTLMQGIELSISHHLLEDATDPLGSGFWDNDLQSNFRFVDGEVSDLCDPISFFYPATYDSDAGPVVATRIWSNQAAGQGDPNPCVPLVGPADQQVAQTIPADILPVSAGQSTSFSTYGVGASHAPASWDIHVFQTLGPSAILPAAGFRATSGPGVVTTVPVTIPSSAHPGDTFGVEIHVLENGFIVDQAVEEVVFSVP